MTLYILDALALAYRAHFAFISRPRVTSRGQNTSAAYGFTTALFKLINEFGIEHVVTVFDVVGEEGGTFRDELFDDYKAHREPPPEALLANLPFIKAILEAMGVPVLEVQGVEADDVIATLARKATEEGSTAVIVSADKDFQQLLDDAVSILKPTRQGDTFEQVTAESFREAFGLEPAQFIDVLALMGDKVDNVPGVTGIGEKTAVALIKEFGDVETLLERAEEVSNKRAREGLAREADRARLSKQLVTLVSDLAVELDWNQATRTEPDWAQIEIIFDQLEFRTLLDRLVPDRAATSASATAGAPLETLDESQATYAIARTRKELEEWLGAHPAGTYAAFETVALRPGAGSPSLVGFAVSTAAGTACFTPVPLPDGTRTGDALGAVIGALHETTVVGRRVKEDLLLLDLEGAAWRPACFDITVAHYLLAPEQRHDLDLLARNLLSYALDQAPDEAKRDSRAVPLEELAREVAERADLIGRLREPLQKELASHGLSPVAERIEMPLVNVLTDMEHVGICVDRPVLDRISAELAAEIAELEREIYEVAGEPFTIGSPQQLAEILYTRLGLPVRSKTSTGQASTRESVLQELSTEHVLPGLILDWRKASKLKSTYADTLGGLVDPRTGRLHTQLNQTVTATGRLSSSNPNLQNIPVRSDKGRQLRRAFVPRDGWLLLSADYVQIELRILASMSGDASLARAFAEGKDIHSDTAARLFAISPEEVTRSQRSKAKEVNYGIPYGMSAFGLAQRLRVPRAEAQALIAAHQELYPGVWTFLEVQMTKARERGYAETLLGRRRYLPGINARNRAERAAAERIAVNMPIQGTQADMIKLAMIRIHDALNGQGLRARLLLQVHDELVLELPPDEEPVVRKLVEAGMTEAFPLDVPIEVELETGPNWLEVH